MKKFFPSLNTYNNLLFFNNAAGTQIPKQVLNSFNDFIINSYSQPFDNNILSKNNKQNINNCNNIVNIITNNIDGKIIYGNSCSQLMFNLSKSIEKNIMNNGNIVIANFNHESCITPFERIALDNNIEINWWKLHNDNNNYSINYNNLFKQINNDTKIVIIPHVSNILGNVLDIELISKKIKEINKDTKIIVDGVAYLPHNIIDLEKYNVDYYVFSFYKFFGLRISGLYIKNTCFNNEIKNINHNFFDKEKEFMEKKLQIGGINYECLNSINGIKDYLIDFSNEFKYKNKTDNNIFDRELYKFCMEKIYFYEKIFDRLLQNILNNKKITYINDNNLEKTPIYSLIFKEYSSKYIVNTLNNLNIITANGSFYSNRLINQLDINEDDGVVRISLMHYNKFSEIEHLVEILKYFDKKEMNFEYKIDYNLSFKISDNIKESFNSLNNDKYYNNLRDRAFSLLKINTDYSIEIMNNAKFFQASNYNDYNGNITRDYKNINHELINDEIFKKLILSFKSNSEKDLKSPINYIYVHQIRVYAEDGKETNLIPEGIHKDGYNIVGMVCINRKNIVGGINGIYNNIKKKVHDVQLEEGDLLIINDNKMYHDVTNIKKIEENVEAYRDIFVFTTIS
tara:strand:- start:1748 stop:3625 length:1878 start_codon:yes stop_codon:yes gene_type:complete